MLREKWEYVANSAEEGAVDCSGAFYYWYRRNGSYMYHGSNTMWRDYTTVKGKIGEIELIPGMAVWRRKDWTLADFGNKYYNDKVGNYHHVGLYIGNGKCIDAKGTKYGIVESDISKWDYAGRLKNTDYDTEVIIMPEEEARQFGIVATQKTGLNLRQSPTTKSSILSEIPKGTKIPIYEESDGWMKTVYSGKTGWVSADYINRVEEQPSEYRKSLSVEVFSPDEFELITSWLNMNGFEYFVENGDD